MASLPVEVLLGVYLGLLVGIIPTLASWGLAFVFKYVTDVTLPGFAVVVLAIALAGVNGGLLALADQTITQAPNAVRIVVAILVVSMGSLWAHAQGDRMGTAVPRRLSLASLRDRTFSSDVVEFVGGRREVRVRVVGDVDDLEGYPPLPEDVRAALRGDEWRFPADLTVGELEGRLADRLRAEYDLEDVAVQVDERGQATVAAAPAFSGLSRRVRPGLRAVSVKGLLPTGLARDDVVTLVTSDATVRGTVLSARCGGTADGGSTASSAASGSVASTSPSAASTGSPSPSATPPAGTSAPGGDAVSDDGGATRAPTTDGGDGRVTVAVDRERATTLLNADRARVLVGSRGQRQEFALLSLVRRAGYRFRRLTVRADGPLDGATVESAPELLVGSSTTAPPAGDAATQPDDAAGRQSAGEAGGQSDDAEKSSGTDPATNPTAASVRVVAVRGNGGWTVAPPAERELTAQEELIVVGPKAVVAGLGEVSKA